MPPKVYIKAKQERDLAALEKEKELQKEDQESEKSETIDEDDFETVLPAKIPYGYYAKKTIKKDE